jgi:hypothetical protein
MIEAKLLVCHILKKVLDISLDVRLLGLVAFFKDGKFSDGDDGGLLKQMLKGVNVLRRGLTSTMQ